MCGRYTLFTGEEYREIREIIEEAERRSQGGPLASGEIHPTNRAPVLVREEPGVCARALKWGYPGFRGKGVIINARRETVPEKRMFSKSLQAKRCVIPSTGFYEWKDKQKYWFTGEEKTLFMAGLYDLFQNEGRFVILTGEANPSVSPIHERMPLVLTREQVEPWLGNAEEAAKLLEAPLPMLQRTAV